MTARDDRSPAIVPERCIRTPLKRDLLGVVTKLETGATAGGLGEVRIQVERDTQEARWWTRWLARRLAAREAYALTCLRHLDGVPRLLAWDGRRLQRSWLAGLPMHQAQPRDAAYYREALRMLRRMHAAGIVHNDLAKEPNWLVDADGRPALLDFQLAARPRYRGRRFRAQAYDDLRHLLKHKRTYRPESLTSRQRAILARRSWVAGLWMRTGKPVYLWVTRGLLGWSDREGASDRGS